VIGGNRQSAFAWRLEMEIRARTTTTVLALSIGFLTAPEFGIAAEPEAVESPMLFSSGFESGTLVDGQGWNISGNAPKITTKYVREGNFAIESYLNRTTSSTSNRTEVRAKAPDAKVGQEYWYGFSVFFPEPYVADNIWEIVGQWHRIPDPGDDTSGLNPPISIEINNGNWRFISRYSTAQPTTEASRKTAFDKLLGPVEGGKWHDWVVHVKWSATLGEGLLQVWKNGVKVVDITGPNCYNDAVAPYFKMGIYKGWSDRISPTGIVSERRFYHDSFRMAGAGGSYAAVSPGSEAGPMPPSDVVVQ
jgi:hypothetical protein